MIPIVLIVFYIVLYYHRMTRKQCRHLVKSNFKKTQKLRSYVGCLAVLAVLVDVFCKSKVTDFNDIILSQQHISCSQITMYKLKSMTRHTVC